MRSKEGGGVARGHSHWCAYQKMCIDSCLTEDHGASASIRRRTDCDRRCWFTTAQKRVWRVTKYKKKEWLESEVDRLNLRDKVHILGNKPVEQMPNYFASADVLLVTLQAHPVMSAWIPGKVQSYLASGKPIIGALDGAGADVINQSKCGFAVPAGDFNGLAEKVTELSNLPIEDKNKMGANALDFYNREFNRDSLITKLEEYFVKIT